MRYTLSVARRLCARLANGESLHATCSDPKMPARLEVYRWLLKKPEFRDLFVEAKRLLADRLAEELVEIADGRRDDRIDGGSPDDGQAAGEQAAGSAKRGAGRMERDLRRDRLRVEARKLALARLSDRTLAMVSDARISGLRPDDLDEVEAEPAPWR